MWWFDDQRTLVYNEMFESIGGSTVTLLVAAVFERI